jgi:hypothetical protein
MIASGSARPHNKKFWIRLCSIGDKFTRFVIVWNEHGNASSIRYSEKEGLEGSDYKSYF